MEEKKLKEIEAKLRRLMIQADKSKKQDTMPATPKIKSGSVIRRRRGQKDLKVA